MNVADQPRFFGKQPARIEAIPSGGGGGGGIIVLVLNTCFVLANLSAQLYLYRAGYSIVTGH